MEKEEVRELIKGELNESLAQYQKFMTDYATETRKISVNMIHEQKQSITANIPRWNLFVVALNCYIALHVTLLSLAQFQPKTLGQTLETVFCFKLFSFLKAIILN